MTNKTKTNRKSANASNGYKLLFKLLHVASKVASRIGLLFFIIVLLILVGTGVYHFINAQYHDAALRIFAASVLAVVLLKINGPDTSGSGGTNGCSGSDGGCSGD